MSSLAAHHPRKRRRRAANDLDPFWGFFGCKWRAAFGYPKPIHETIVEPFAGAAGYSLRHSDRKVVLVEQDPIIAEVWRYLIRTPASEILEIPLVDRLKDLPPDLPNGARWLVGFNLSAAVTAPRQTLSSGLAWLRANGRPMVGWSEAKRDRVAAQVDAIRHWQIIEGNYTLALDLVATWFIDAPYQGKAGCNYRCSSKLLDYLALGSWAQSRQGQVIVCEAVGADWLPFRHHKVIKAGPRSQKSVEAIWTNDELAA